jgi:outer membrane protein insertion porin family
MKSPIPFIFTVLALTTSPALAQLPFSFVGAQITGVQIVREGQPIDDPSVSSLVETRAGEPLVMSEVRESITHVFGLGRFQDVQVEAIAAPGGVALRYNLVPLHPVQRVDFRGVPSLGLSEGLLRSTVTARFGASPLVGRAPEAARTLEQLYRDHGYLRATVKPVPTERHDPDRTVLEFDITPGPHALIANARVEGQPAEGADAFLRQVHAAPSQRYEPATITTALANYVQKLRRKARYEATASYQARPAADGTTVDLTVMLQAGPIVTIAFDGDPLPKDKLNELVPVAREVSVDEDLIEDSIQRIRTLLRSQGYWKADASATREEGDGTLRIVFTVRRGSQYRIVGAGVEVNGNRAVPVEQLRPALARLQPGDVFVESNLAAAVTAVAGHYQRLGFAQAKISAAVNEVTPESGGQLFLRPTITIAEGPLTRIGEIRLEGNASVPEEELRPLVTSAAGAPYYEPSVVSDREAVLLEYRNRGFAAATVVVVPSLSPDGTRADLKFQITEGQQTIVDHVLITGNVQTDQRVIQRELLLQQGKPLGQEDLIESQRRLGALGLFRRIRIEELSHGGALSDVLVTVEEAAATTFSYGGGLEAARLLRESAEGQAQERLEIAPRGFFDVGRRNLGGKNRSADLYTRLSLRPGGATSGSDDTDLFAFPEYRVVATYREPRAFGLNADFLFTAAVEQGVRSSFNFARKGINVEVVRRLGPGLRTSARYYFGTTRTFAERLSDEDQSRIDRLFPQVRLSAVGGAISRDTRDDVLDPARGTFVSAEATLATRALGGQVGFAKSYVQGFWFHRLPVDRRVVVASRLALGLADGFPRPVTAFDIEGQPITLTIEDLPASERFFAGGDTTIRGFALDSVGAPNTISPTGFPRGGNALVVANAELRLPIWKDLGAAVFADGGNVFRRATELDLGELRGSSGFGLRYRSPIGPIRFDVGFKMDRRVVGGVLEGRRALHFSIGQAF